MARHLQLRTQIKSRTWANPSMCHLFSTGKSENDELEASSSSETSAKSQSSLSDYLSDVKARLNRRQPASPSSNPTSRKTLTFTDSDSSSPRPSKAASLEELRKNLSEFRRGSSAPPLNDPISSTPSSPSQQPISFQEIYKRNVMAQSGESTEAANKPGRMLSFAAISNSLRKVQGARSDRKTGDSLSLSAFRDSLKLKPSDSAVSGTSSMVIGGTGTLPASVFGKEMREEGQSSAAMKTEFVKMYSYEELGKKLSALRPEAKGEGWFSLAELNERLLRLREKEEKDAESAGRGVLFKDVRESLIQMKLSGDEKAKRTSMQRLDFLGQLGRTPSFMLEPPKENLVEKYFHLDNMSSAEKMKIELTKVRDEFKMSESDCGSARVQVAQLTTKIKHLSSALHKKDKHSRKGLQAMVEKRKRLLRYLRRTDWESYCFVISKLGLRDYPDLKH
ncbi:hypothetical protein L6164_004536 [Bauhinia variegata]|uniref:Uncharacterized protein n=1 Tax=Bauhinia variegata TaxID=167791 RepID=A0ACB9Q4Q7_BAUVA|nr:hypothetical protein L6164_004536 [Bauhinia variegata]